MFLERTERSEPEHGSLEWRQQMRRGSLLNRREVLIWELSKMEPATLQKIVQYAAAILQELDKISEGSPVDDLFKLRHSDGRV
jgi:hypothetical protein